MDFRTSSHPGYAACEFRPQDKLIQSRELQVPHRVARPMPVNADSECSCRSDRNSPQPQFKTPFPPTFVPPNCVRAALTSNEPSPPSTAVSTGPEATWLLNLKTWLLKYSRRRLLGQVPIDGRNCEYRVYSF